MGHIFISHRAISDDLELARTLRKSLQNKGHSVFLAGDSLQLGDRWPERIAAELRKADALLLLLSEAAAASEMVIEEVRQARDLRFKTQKPKILPIRLGVPAGAPLPYDLAAYLGRLQQISWMGNDDTPRLMDQLDFALEHIDAPSLEDEEETEELERPPSWNQSAPNNTWKPEDGPLHPPGAPYSSQWYAPRLHAERDAHAYLQQAGSPVVVVGPYQIGKSYFLAHLLADAAKEGDQIISLNLDYFADESLKDLSTLLFEIALELSDTLGVDFTELEKAWRLPAHPMRKLTRFLERSLLPRVTGRLLLSLDRADGVLKYDYHNDFFALLRSWASRPGHPTWAKLRLLMSVSTEPALLVQDTHLSPFNLTAPIRLRDFGAEEIAHLAQCHRLRLPEAAIQSILDNIGGHPYLVRLSLYQMAHHGVSLEDLLSSMHSEQGVFADHLRSKLLRLRANAPLAEALRQLLDNEQAPIDYILAHRLYGAGLIRGRPGHYQLRYPLYRQFLRDRI